MNQQNLNLYHIFHETAVCGSLSNAAKRLYISQPAISKAISKLESNLSATLFIRNSRGVKLTPEGELLFKQIDTAFHAIRQGEEQLWQNHELGSDSFPSESAPPYVNTGFFRICNGISAKILM